MSSRTIKYYMVAAMIKGDWIAGITISNPDMSIWIPVEA